MIVYYVVYVIIAIIAISVNTNRNNVGILFWLAIFVFLVIFIGYRYRVGGDWAVYIEYMQDAEVINLTDALSLTEPGYALLNWISASFFGSIYFVNVVCAIIFSLGVVYFCFNQPQPTLTLAVAFPYIILVIGMGYTRQSVAFGFALIALIALARSDVKRFIFFIVIGILFHRSVIIMLGILLFTQRNSRITTLLIVSAIAYFVANQYSQEYGALYENYTSTDRASSGALVRAIMSVIPSVALLIWGRSFDDDEVRLRVWRTIAMVNIGIFPFILVAAVAADRLMLYFISIQMYVIARLAKIAKLWGHEVLVKIAVVGFYFVVLVTWLNYADNAEAWIPYRTALFQEN